MAEMVLNPKKFGWAAAKVMILLSLVTMIVQFVLMGMQGTSNLTTLMLMQWAFFTGLPQWLSMLFHYGVSILFSAIYGYIAGYLFAYFYNRS